MKREFIGISLLVLIFGITISIAWGFIGVSPGRARAENSSGPLFTSMEYRLLQIQGEVLVGARQFLSGAGKNLIAPEVGNKELKRGFYAVFMTPGEQKASVRAGALRRGLILARFLGFGDEEEKLEAEINQIAESSNLSAEDINANALVLRALKNEASSSDWVEIRNHLPWYGTLLALATEAAEARTSDQQLSKPQFLKRAENRFVRMMLGFCVVTVFFILSALLVIVFAALLWSGALRTRFEPGALPAYLSLEIFVLYLAAMLGMSKVLELLGERFDIGQGMLAINAVMIPAMLVLIFWPRFWRRPWREIRQALGLSLDGTRQFVLDLFAGPLAYVTAIVPLLLVLSIYSWGLMKAGVDITKGAHPLVPVLILDSTSKTKLMVALLVSIIAPVVEEIMFRGAFYTWLRSHFSAATSILSSAILFASIHPQGPIGLVPLASIGIVLAALREWRQSLVAPVLAHACFNSGTLLIMILIFGGGS